MFDKRRICQACLRTDKKLRVIDKRILEFYYELCDGSMYNTLGSEFCLECEFMLNKIYNFIAKCHMAIKILNGQIRTNERKCRIHKLLPPSTLGMWSPGEMGVYQCKHEEQPKPLTESDIMKPIISGPSNKLQKSNIRMIGRISAAHVSFPYQLWIQRKILTDAWHQNVILLQNIVPYQPCQEIVGANHNTQNNDTQKIVGTNYMTQNKVRLKIVRVNNLTQNIAGTNNLMQKIVGTNNSMQNNMANNVIQNQVTHKFVGANNSLQNQVTHKFARTNNLMQNKVTQILSPHNMKQNNVTHTNISVNNKTQNIVYAKHMPQIMVPIPMNNLNNDCILVDELRDPLLNEGEIKLEEETQEFENKAEFIIEEDSDSVIENEDTVKEEMDESTILQYPDSVSDIIDCDNSDGISDFNNDSDQINNVIFTKENNKKESEDNRRINEEKEVKVSDRINEEEKVSKDNYATKVTKKRCVIGKSIVKSKKRIIDYHPNMTLEEIVNRRESMRKKKVTKRLKRRAKPVSAIFDREWCKEELKLRFDLYDDIKTDDGVVINKDSVLELMDSIPENDLLLRILWRNLLKNEFLTKQDVSIFRRLQNRYDRETEAVFDSIYLHTQEQVVEEFNKRQYFDSYVNAQFKCEFCYTAFSHKKSLDYHMRCFHDVKVGSFVCVLCNTRWRSKRNFSLHVQRHRTIYKCKLCPLVTYYKNTMKNHYNQHRGVQANCDNCYATFKSQSALNAHRAQFCSNTVFPHVCVRCARAFRTYSGKNHHENLKHRNDPSVNKETGALCPYCSLTFVSQKVYEKHLFISHSKRKDGTDFKIVRSDTKYAPQNSEKKVVKKCLLCNKVGPNMFWLRRHFAQEHPDSNIVRVKHRQLTMLCHICGKAFAIQSRLNDHLNTHKGAYPYACGVCEKKFQQKQSLYLHLRRHAPPNKACTLCGKKFHTLIDLEMHMKRHSGNRSAVCNVCGLSFLNKTALNKHLDVHEEINEDQSNVMDSDNEK